MKLVIILIALQYINLTSYTRLIFNCFVYLNFVVYLVSERATHVCLQTVRLTDPRFTIICNLKAE